jgi:hypothetical protein
MHPPLLNNRWIKSSHRKWILSLFLIFQHLHQTNHYLHRPGHRHDILQDQQLLRVSLIIIGVHHRDWVGDRVASRPKEGEVW